MTKLEHKIGAPEYLNLTIKFKVPRGEFELLLEQIKEKLLPQAIVCYGDLIKVEEEK